MPSIELSERPDYYPIGIRETAAILGAHEVTNLRRFAGAMNQLLTPWNP